MSHRIAARVYIKLAITVIVDDFELTVDRFDDLVLVNNLILFEFLLPFLLLNGRRIILIQMFH